MVCDDNFSRLKFIRFLGNESDAKEALRRTIGDHFTAEGLKIVIIYADGGGELQGMFQPLLSELGIEGGSIPLYIPHFIGRALGLLLDKTMAFLRGIMDGKIDCLWAVAGSDERVRIVEQMLQIFPRPRSVIRRAMV